MAAARNAHSDRFGLGWRPEYAASILCHAEEIDIVEIVAENFMRDKALAKSLRTLSAQIPVTLHSVSLGLASSVPVEVKRLERLARLFDIFTPDSWSEHFAFVRAGGYEIGHLAAPPRSDNTIKGTLRNLRLAERVVGGLPSLENIATLIKPPSSTLSEWRWMDCILGASSSDFLLDLHNLLANCLNCGEKPQEVLRTLPLEKVRLVHLSGGKWIPNPHNLARLHLLDDHLHDVPDAVYALLTTLAQRCPNPLTVIIERDGNYPPFEMVLAQLRRARRAVEEGRTAQTARSQVAYEHC